MHQHLPMAIHLYIELAGQAALALSNFCEFGDWGVLLFRWCRVLIVLDAVGSVAAIWM